MFLNSDFFHEEIISKGSYYFQEKMKRFNVLLKLHKTNTK